MPYVRAPFSWFGGKYYMLKHIIPLLSRAPHTVGVDVFGGSGVVSLNWPETAGRLHVYNDLNGGVVSFFRVLRDHTEDLVGRLQLTPCAREEFTDCLEPSGDPVEAARRFFVLNRQCFGGGGRARPIWGRDLKKPPQPMKFIGSVDGLGEIACRMRGWQIESLDFRRVLTDYDSSNTLFYLDPPYVAASRTGRKYSHEMTDTDHVDLVSMLPRLKGKWLLSGYDSPLYTSLSQYELLRVDMSAGGGSTRPAGLGSNRTEILWGRL